MTTVLAQYGRILRARWRWIVWGVLIALAATTTAMAISPPTYRSDALVFIRTPGDTSRVSDGGALYASVRADTYAAMATRGDISRRVVSDLGLDMSPGQLSNRIYAKAHPGTVLISLSVDGSSPAQAQQIATVVLTEWQATVRSIESVPGGVVPRAELAIVDPPDRALRIVAWGAPLDRALLGVIVLGAVLGAFAAVLREIFGRPNADSAADSLEPVDVEPVVFAASPSDRNT